MPLIYFIRHAESIANAGGATQWPADITLSERGHAQARALAASWSQAPSLIVASPYIRTQLTAQPTRDRFPEAPFEIWPIQEFTYLNPNNLTGTTAAQRQPLVEAYWKNAQPDNIDGPGAESFNHMLSRIADVKARLQALDVPVVKVFTHGQIMGALILQQLSPKLTPTEMMRAFHSYAAQHTVHNCSILKAQANPKEFTLTTQLFHLEDATTSRH